MMLISSGSSSSSTTTTNTKRRGRRRRLRVRVRVGDDGRIDHEEAPLIPMRYEQGS